MITLNGITINDSMYLDGVDSSRITVHEKKISIGGYSKIYSKKLIGGREFTLGTQNSSGPIQGIWLKSEIDAIKAVESLCSPVVLNYRGTQYNVIIADTSDFRPLHQFEIEGANKRFLGKITLMEV